MSGSGARAEAKSTGTRWWESYLVRYFSGFIVGTICVAAIIAYALPPDRAMKILGPALYVLHPDAQTEPTKVVAAKSVTHREGAEHAIERSISFEVHGVPRTRRPVVVGRVQTH